MEFDTVTAKSLDEAKELMDESIQIALVDVRLPEEDERNRDEVRFLECWCRSRGAQLGHGIFPLRRVR